MNEKIFPRRLFLAALVILAAVALCAAQQGVYAGLNAKALKTSDVTWLDLIKKVFADARLEPPEDALATTEEPIPVRNLLGDSAWNGKDAAGVKKVFVAHQMETIDGAGKILWVIFGAWRSANRRCSNCGLKILAAFRVSRDTAQLIDAANVKTDDETGFYEAAPRLRIAARREAVIIENRTQLSIGTNSFSVIAADKNGFKVLLEDHQKFDASCGNWIREDAQIRLLKTKAGGYRNIEIRVVTEAGGNNMEDEAVETRRRFRYLYVWQPHLETYAAVINPGKRRERLLERVYPCRDYRPKTIQKRVPRPEQKNYE